MTRSDPGDSLSTEPLPRSSGSAGREAFLHVRIVTSNVNCATEIVVDVVVAVALTQPCTQRLRRRSLARSVGRSGSTYQLGVYFSILTHRKNDQQSAHFRVSMSSTAM